MQSVIEEIYFNGSPQHEHIGHSAEYDRLSAQFDRLHGKLEATLNKEQKEMLDSLWMLSAGLETESNYTHYKEGVKFGMRFATEALSEEDETS